VGEAEVSAFISALGARSRYFEAASWIAGAQGLDLDDLKSMKEPQRSQAAKWIAMQLLHSDEDDNTVVSEGTYGGRYGGG
jgi:hypothetical protein